MIKSGHMRTLLKPAALAAVLSLLASALPAAAASGDVASIALRDFNHNGKIDRAVVTFANPEHAAWSVNDTSGISVTHGGAAIGLADAFIASSADPAVLEIVLDENDADLPVSTSAEGFEVSYARVGLSGVSGGGQELPAIPADDAAAAHVERDEAAPILTGSTPVSGSYDTRRDTDLVLFFSEAVDVASLAAVSEQNPGQWSFSASSDGRTVNVGHAVYRRGDAESFAVTGKDLAGNAIAPGAYPNPFTFRIGTDTNPTAKVDTVFAITSPAPFVAFQAGPTVIAWYANQPEVTSVRLSFSKDGGQTYAPIATVPVAQGTYVWNPPAITSSFQIRAEGLGSTGNLLNFAIASPLSMTGTPPTFRVVSGPTTSMSSPSSVLVSLRTDAAPASAMLQCQGLAPVQATMHGDRPVRVEAQLTGLTAGPTYDCEFILTDASGAALSVDVPAFRAEPDEAGPILLGPAVIDAFDLTARTAKLTWSTDEPSRAEVAYGPQLDYSGRASLTSLATSHEVTLMDLTPGAMHQVRITSTDAQGNAAVSRDYFFVFLREGDLIKGAGAAVYWYKGGKRSAFPHENVYVSWFGADFSKVIRVPDTQLGTIALGANVTMKAGVYMVKIQSDPKTYAVEPDGVLRWIPTEAQARALYGDAWAKRVRDVDVSLFTDYVIGPALEGNEKPAGYVG